MMRTLHRIAPIAGIAAIAALIALSTLLITNYQLPTTLAQSSSPPAKPTGLTATPGNERIYLTWNNPNDPSIVSYEWRYSFNGFSWESPTVIFDSNASTAAFVLSTTGVMNEREVHIQIRATNHNGDSPWSDSATATPSDLITNPTDTPTPTATNTPTVTNTPTITNTPTPTATHTPDSRIPPAKPTGLKAVPGNNRVYLTWNNPNNPYITSYRVEYTFRGDTTWANLLGKDVSGNIDAYVLGTPFFNDIPTIIRIRAVNANGNSPWSDTVHTTPSASLANPTNTPIPTNTPTATNTPTTTNTPAPTDTPEPIPTQTGFTSLILKRQTGLSETLISDRLPTTIHSTETYTVQLTDDGLAGQTSVTVNITSSDHSKVTVHPETLTFTDTTTAKTVTISAYGIGTAVINHEITYPGGALSPRTRSFEVAVASLPSGVDPTLIPTLVPPTATDTPAPTDTPAKPTGFAVIPGNARLYLSWENPNDPSITHYQLQARVAGTSWSTANWVTITGSNANTISYFESVGAVGNNIEYDVRIRAVNNNGNGPHSDTVSARPTSSLTNPTDTPTAGPTNTPAPTNTPTATNTPAPTNTPEPTSTPTATNTPDPSASATPTPTTTNTPQPTNTPTATNTPDPSASPTPTPTTTNTPEPTNTPTATNTPDPSASPTPTPTTTNTPQPTNTPTATNTPDPSASPTPTPTTTNTPQPTNTPTATNTPDPSASPTPTPTTTNTPEPTNTPTATNTPDPSASATPTPTTTNTPEPTNTPTTIPTTSATTAPTDTPSTTTRPTATKTPKPTVAPTPRRSANQRQQIATPTPRPTRPTNTPRPTATTRPTSTPTPTATPTHTPTPRPIATRTPTDTPIPTATTTPTATRTPLPTAINTATPIATQPPMQPVAPGEVSVIPSGSGALITWNSGDNGTCTNDAFFVRVLDPNGTPADESYLIHQPNVGPTNWSASGLAPSSPYTVIIYGYSYSCQKYSPFQGETTFTTTDGSDDPEPGTPTPMEILLDMFGTRPTKPADVEVTTSSNGTATITWSQGDTDDQCPSTLYFARLYEVGGPRIAQSNYIPQPQSGNPTWNVSDLKPGTQYLIAVYAYGHSCDTFAIHPTRATFTTTQ